jgi:hypothetical protein
MRAGAPLPWPRGAVVREARGGPAAIERAFRLVYGRRPSPEEARLCLAHWSAMTERHRSLPPVRTPPPREVAREAVDEGSGERFTFVEKQKLEAYDDFVADLGPGDVGPEVRGLAEVCLVLFNSNEFVYVY